MAKQATLSAAELEKPQWALLAQSVRRLEESWRAKRSADLSGLVPPRGEPLRERVLVELVKVDQEFRWESGERKPLESYLADWPELKGNSEVVAELLEAECLTRAALDNLPTVEELRSRFPDLCDRMDLAAIAGAAEAERGPARDAVAAETSRAAIDQTTPPPGASAPALSPGQRFGRYEIRSLLGHGGMGSVYRAYHPQLDCEVALKTPRFDPLREPDVLERFVREARAAAKVRHPNICPIHDAGQIEGTYYISMALIEGQNLADWIKDRTLQPREAAELVRKLADALQTVHAAGIIHRDIKAANVMIDSAGEPLLMDFGLARQIEKDVQVTTDGMLLGAPAYMSPEQVNGEPADARSDVYSLGVLVYQLLTGQLPFTGPLTKVLSDIGNAEPPAPRSLRPDLDPAVESICLKAMSKSPAARFQSAGEMGQALQEYLAGTFQVPRQPSRLRHKLWLAGLAAAGLVLLGIIVKITIEIGSTRGARLSYGVAWSVQGSKAFTGDVNGDGKLEVVVDDGAAIQVYDAAGKPVGPPIKDAGVLSLLADVDKSRLLRIVTSEAVPGPDRPLGEKDEPKKTPLRLHVYAGDGQRLKTLETDGLILPLDARFSQKPTISACLAAVLDAGSGVQIIASKSHHKGDDTRGIVVFDYESGKERWYHSVGPMPRDIAVAGLRGNALKDIIFAGIGPDNGVKGEDGTVDNRCYIFRLKGDDGKPVWIRRFEGQGNAYSSVALADVDADGYLDIVATSWTVAHEWSADSIRRDPSRDLGRVYVLDPADGKTRPGYERNIGSPVEVAGTADFDGDGRPEILVTVRDEKTRTGWLMILRGTPELPEVAKYSRSGLWLSVAAINDLNGDGHPEVLVKAGRDDLKPQPDDTLLILDHKLGAAPLWTWKPGGPIGSAIMSDLDGDGIKEIVVCRGSMICVLAQRGHTPK